MLCVNKLQVLKLAQSFSCLSQKLCVPLKYVFVSFFQRTDAFIDSRHEHIGRTAGLKHMQIPAHTFSVHSRSVHMQEGSLRQRRKCFVQAVYDDIRALYISILRKIRMKSEMLSVSFIQNEYSASCVH